MTTAYEILSFLINHKKTFIELVTTQLDEKHCDCCSTKKRLIKTGRLIQSEIDLEVYEKLMKEFES